MWKITLYNEFGIVGDTIIPNSLAQTIFEDNNLSCIRDYPDFKVFVNNKRTLVFDRILADKEDMKNE